VSTALGEDGIAVVTLDRSEKMNALDIHMFDAVVNAADGLRENEGVRAVVIHGNGRSFCAGLDMSSILRGALWGDFSAPRRLLDRNPGPVKYLGDKVNLAQALGWVWRDFPVPVVAAIHGVCFGGGLQLALGADMRFCSPTCRLSVMEAKWGLIPDMGGTVMLRELMPMDLAKDITMTGRIINGAEAYELGLVNSVVNDPLVASMQHARELVANMSREQAMRLKESMLEERYNAFRCTEGKGQGTAYTGKSAGETKQGGELGVEITKGCIGTFTLSVNTIDRGAIQDLHSNIMSGGKLASLRVLIVRFVRSQEAETADIDEGDVCLLRNSWHSLPIPVLATFDESCGAHCLAASLGADFRIASDECSIELDPAQLQQNDNGSSVLLRSLVGKKRIIPTGVVSAEEACNLGLVTR
jgi:enoyl-CoA hydratase/carnithine racemase